MTLLHYLTSGDGLRSIAIVLLTTSHLLHLYAHRTVKS